MGPSLSRRFRAPAYLSELPISYCEKQGLTSVEQDELYKNYVLILYIKHKRVRKTTRSVLGVRAMMCKDHRKE